jgi:hypothetical protein
MAAPRTLQRHHGIHDGSDFLTSADRRERALRRRNRGSREESAMRTTGTYIRHRTTAIVMLAALIATLGVPVIRRANAVEPTPADAVVEWNTNAQIAIVGVTGHAHILERNYFLPAA